MTSKQESDKIDNHKAISLLVDSMSDLKIKWDNYIAENYFDKNIERNDYIDIGEISRHIVFRIQTKNTNDFNQFFEALENILKHCQFNTKEFMEIGFIEGLQNICGWEKIDYRKGFDNWLLPVTKRHWQDVIKYWEE